MTASCGSPLHLLNHVSKNLHFQFPRCPAGAAACLELALHHISSWHLPLPLPLALHPLQLVSPGDRIAVVGDGKLGLLIAQLLAVQGHDVMHLGRHKRKLGLVEGTKKVVVAEDTAKELAEVGALALHLLLHEVSRCPGRTKASSRGGDGERGILVRARDKPGGVGWVCVWGVEGVLVEEWR